MCLGRRFANMDQMRRVGMPHRREGISNTHGEGGNNSATEYVTLCHPWTHSQDDKMIARPRGT